MPVIAEVQIRRCKGLKVKPEAEIIDGENFRVSPCGIAGSGPFSDEQAWKLYLSEEQEEAGAPTWVAQGDLIFVMGT